MQNGDEALSKKLTAGPASPTINSRTALSIQIEIKRGYIPKSLKVVQVASGQVQRLCVTAMTSRLDCC